MSNFTDNNLKPVHNALQPLGTSSTHTTDVAIYQQSLTAFTSLATSATGSTHTATKRSGYIYINTAVSSLVKIFEETINCADNLRNIGVFLEETNPSTDELNKVTGLYKTFEDVIDCTDSVSSFSVLGETTPNLDTLFVAHKKIFTETCDNVDSVISVVPFDESNTVTVQNTPYFNQYASFTISVDRLEDTPVPVNVVVTPNNVVLVTNLTSLSNPFLPTVISGGVTLVTNVCTAPPPSYVPGPQPFINYLNIGIGTTSLCQMTNSNMTLDYNGGSFSVSSQDPLGVSQFYQGNLGRQITVFGFTGTITDFGKDITNSSNSYVTSGIFGTPLLNKSFNLITYGNMQFFQFLGAQNSITLAPQVNSYTTIKGMATTIANMCGVTLSWLIPDAPYHDIFGQTGMTGLEALNTLAGQMGGYVRWNGDNSYVVAYPDYTLGNWSVPDYRLLTASGIKYSYHLDLGYGVSGSGVLGIPSNVLFDSANKTIPETQDTNPDEVVEKIATVTKPFTVDDPTMVVPLPNDIISVKIQILVKTGTVTAGARYVTDNPSIWFDLGSPGISNPYVQVTKSGNAFINELHANYTLFPSLDAINNGNFVMSFGIVRRSLNTQFDNTKEDTDLLRRELQARILANVRFIKTYSGTISCRFFGTIPVPGMFASVDYCGEQVSGVIEQVSLTGDGILTLEVARYLRVNLLDRKLQLDLLQGTYGNY